MQQRRQVMEPSPSRRLVGRRCPGVGARRTARRGDVDGVGVRPSGGCAGRGYGAERPGQERAR